MKPLAPWQFTQIDDQKSSQWSCRKVAADGSLEFSTGPFDDYAGAVLSAIQQGFKPGADHYVVITGSGVRHHNHRRRPK